MSTEGNNLRARHANVTANTDVVEIDFEGRRIPARRGESLLAALVASGETSLRITQCGELRGPFCGMGVCQECLLEVNGVPAQRACLTTVETSLHVRRQSSKVKRPLARERAACTEANPETDYLTPQVAVIGGGPAGMVAAATAARAGADVVLVDERTKLGGQFFKQPVDASDLDQQQYDDQQFRDGRQLIDELEDSGATVLGGATVVGVYEPLDVVVLMNGQMRLIRPEILIVATGAFEISHPFPGWTLPGVMTTGAAQTLLRSYRVLPGRNILVAGNGPLNMQVAAELLKAGAQSVAVAETAPRPGVLNLRAIGRMVSTSPGLTARGIRYLYELLRKRAAMHYAHEITRVDVIDDDTATRLRASLRDLTADRHATRELSVDAVCLGYGFRASNEILRALGCRQTVNPASRNLETVCDDNCVTSRPDVFAIGDCAKLRGAHVAQAEGRIAAAAALDRLGIALSSQQHAQTAKARARRNRRLAFQHALWTLFQSRQSSDETMTADTVVCRCENVTSAELMMHLQQADLSTMGSLKRLTRAGMGRCQGRYCGPVIAKHLSQKFGRAFEESDHWAPRPPIKPVAMADLATLQMPGDE